MQKAQNAGYATENLGLIYNRVVSELANLSVNDQLDVLELMALNDDQYHYSEWIDQLDSTTMAQHDRFRLKAERIKQIAKLPFDTSLVVDLHQETALGAWYYQDHDVFRFGRANPLEFNMPIYSLNPVEFNLTAFDMLQDLGYTDTLDLIIQYFLEDQSSHLYRTTIAKAEMLNRLIPYVLEEDMEIEPNTLVLEGRISKTYDQFPVEVQLPASSEIRSEAESITYFKTGTGPLFVSWSQSEWETHPTAQTDMLDIQTSFHQNGEAVNGAIEQGSPLIMKVELEMKKKGDYILLKIPIPSGCSIGNKSHGKHPLENHREYFKHQVNIYFQHLPEGSPEKGEGKISLEIELEPRYTGQYQLNPANAELMYFPSLQANNAAKILRISE
ncbi:MAG: hypothetical protein AAF598_04725 [Bacteroidota bacterium]